MVAMGIAATTMFSSCNDDGKKEKTEVVTTISGELPANVEGVTNVEFRYGMNNYATTSDTVGADRTFVIALPAAPADSILVQVGAIMPDSMKLSNPEVRLATSSFSAITETGIYPMYYATETVAVQYMYADRPCTISGTVTIGEVETSYEGSLLKGWNVAYSIRTGPTSSIMTTTRPKDLNPTWICGPLVPFAPAE
jgi:hypothetical protein